MRQVIKDRIARLDAQITELQELYKTKFTVDGSKAFGLKSIELKIHELVAKRGEIIDRALFAPIGKNKYEIGLADRQANYDDSLEEQKVYMDSLAQAVKDGDLETARRYRVKLGNCNRIVAIYKNSLDTWTAKSSRV